MSDPIIPTGAERQHLQLLQQLTPAQRFAMQDMVALMTRLPPEDRVTVRAFLKAFVAPPQPRKAKR